MKGTTSAQSCGCCEGIEMLTPMPTANRPGLEALAYRVGTHASFLETMKARLSNLYLEIPSEGDGRGKQKIYPLRALTTRDGGDPSIALLDVWATVADVLTFYQERVANEGYLRTATQRRSILELARLVGYRLRPGVAASVYLAFELVADGDPVEIPAGTRAQSLPGPGDLPQSFETSEPLPARAEWNALKPRLKRPQYIATSNANLKGYLYFEGTTTNLKPNAPLLLVFGDDPGKQTPRRVKSVDPKPAENRTKVTLQEISEEELFRAFSTMIKSTISHYTSTAPRGVTAEEVVKTLTALQEHLERNAEEVAVSLGAKTLPELRDVRDGLPDSFKVVKRWVGELIADLERISVSPTTANAITIATTPLEQPSISTRSAAAPGSEGKISSPPLTPLMGLIAQLAEPPSVQPANAFKLRRDVQDVFALRADFAPNLIAKVLPQVGDTLYQAWTNLAVTPSSPLQRVEAFRVKAALFGHNIPGLPKYTRVSSSALSVTYPAPTLNAAWMNLTPGMEGLPMIALDAEYEQITPESWIAIERPDLTEKDAIVGRITTIHKVKSTQVITMSAFGVSARSTLLTIEPPWLSDPDATLIRRLLSSPVLLRGTTVYAQGEELPLADEPITSPICGKEIELGILADGLEAGRWLIVSGERDLPGTKGVKASEPVMLSEVKQDVHKIPIGDSLADLPDDKTHTFIQLANELAYCYKSDTVTIYANVVKATHGETRQEVLGSGDGSKGLQQFTLKQSPLTYTAAPTPAGAESTLKMYVNDVRWHEAESLVDLSRTDRKYTTETDNEGKTTAVFGDGQRGARLPTGSENIRAKYRSGIGKPGNVAAEQISLLASRPLGVKGVINPRRASGGADPESRDQARSNAPLAVMALDRLVSVQDYADFAHTFAGIGKASAVRLTDGRRQLVHVTIAGADDIPIDEESDLYRNLVMALRQHGDPHQPIEVEMRELMVLIISARVRLLLDYLWESVAPQIRNALLEAFGFERRELGQDVLQSEVISVIQLIPGVAYVDLDVLNSVSEAETKDATLLEKKLKELTGEEANGTTKGPRPRIPVEMARPGSGDGIAPAQLAILSPDLPDTLILTEIS